MAWSKTVVSPLLTHGRYHSLVLSHRNIKHSPHVRNMGCFQRVFWRKLTKLDETCLTLRVGVHVYTQRRYCWYRVNFKKVRNNSIQFKMCICMINKLIKLQSHHESAEICSHIRTHRVESRFASSQWETALLCNDVSYWLGASLESALYIMYMVNHMAMQGARASTGMALT